MSLRRQTASKTRKFSGNHLGCLWRVDLPVEMGIPLAEAPGACSRPDDWRDPALAVGDARSGPGGAREKRIAGPGVDGRRRQRRPDIAIVPRQPADARDSRARGTRGQRRCQGPDHRRERRRQGSRRALDPRALGARVTAVRRGQLRRASPKRCSSRSCSATSRAASPAPIATSPASCSSRIAARCSSTKSAR